MRYNNYHKHTHYSNISTIDCVVKPEDYMKRAVELGHTTYFTTEHGWQGNIFEAYTLCKEYGLKCIYAVEAYYVDDMYDTSDRKNYHIMLIAVNNEGRKEINRALSKANTEGFYYKPRIDLKCLLSFTPSNVIITTACIGGRLFKDDKWEESFLKPVHNHFKNNFFLEVQSHICNSQANYNRKILEVHEKYNIPLIHANDSHYIHPKDSRYRDMLLKAKDIYYEEEDGFVLDYPDVETIAKRYLKQGVLDKNDILEALKNTLVLDKCDGIELDYEFKIPKVNNEILRKELNDETINNTQSNKILRKIIADAWNKEKHNIKPELLDKYKEAIAYEINIVEKCEMADYFILNYIIVKKAVQQYGAVLTRSGRGSAVSFYINKLLGLTEVDRIKAPIKLYPTRFMSAERILSSRSLPDIDLNFADTEPVVKASKDILGDDGIYYMVAYGKMKDSQAFKMWCKAKNLNFDEYNEIGKNIDAYREHPRWASIIEESKVFLNVIDSISPSPCSFLLLDKPISSEVGLMKVGDQICCSLDGLYCDKFKYVKNDFLTVKVYDIIDKTYKMIGKPIDDISTLINNCDDKVWKLIEDGITTTINQCDSDYDKQILKKYKPKSLAEMSAYVAAIRPGFASLLNTFIERKEYTTGNKELDLLLEDSYHFMMYQESIMSYLIWLGIEEKETYDIIKKIAKKIFTDEQLKELEDKLHKGWIAKVGNDAGFKETWQVVQDAAHYSFNASHSLSVAIDGLYGAYLKSHYPFEYYSVVFSLYSDDIDRTAKLVEELDYFDIKLEPIKFGKSGADYTLDKNNKAIYKGISSIKYCNAKIAEELLELSKNKYETFIDLLIDIKNNTSVNARQLGVLTKLNFFSEFGKRKYLLDLIDLYKKLGNVKQLNKSKLDEMNIPLYLVKKYSGKETEKIFKDIDNRGLLKEVIGKVLNIELNILDIIKAEMEYLGNMDYINPKIDPKYYVVVGFNEKIKNKNSVTPRLTLKRIHDGKQIQTRIKRAAIYRDEPFGKLSILKIDFFDEEKKSRKDENGKWIKINEKEIILNQYEVIKNVYY